MRKHAADRDAGADGRFIRAWRWLRSSGFSEDDQAKQGPEADRQAKERFGRAVLTQITFWRAGADRTPVVGPPVMRVQGGW
jgi:hypothetical protein